MCGVGDGKGGCGGKEKNPVRDKSDSYRTPAADDDGAAPAVGIRVAAQGRPAGRACDCCGAAAKGRRKNGGKRVRESARRCERVRASA